VAGFCSILETFQLDLENVSTNSVARLSSNANKSDLLSSPVSLPKSFPIAIF